MRQIIAIHEREGGCTFSLIDGDRIGRPGYAVAILEDVAILVEGRYLDAAELTAWIEAHFALLGRPENSIGTWYDTESGLTSIDVSTIIQGRDEAIRVAQAHNQDAIFDLARLEEIRVPDE